MFALQNKCCHMKCGQKHHKAILELNYWYFCSFWLLPFPSILKDSQQTSNGPQKLANTGESRFQTHPPHSSGLGSGTGSSPFLLHYSNTGCTNSTHNTHEILFDLHSPFSPSKSKTLIKDFWVSTTEIHLLISLHKQGNPSECYRPLHGGLSSLPPARPYDHWP